MSDPMPLADACTELAVLLEATGKVDGCPTGCGNTEPARSWTPLDIGYRTAHLCRDCGHAWTTDWRL